MVSLRAVLILITSFAVCMAVVFSRSRVVIDAFTQFSVIGFLVAIPLIRWDKKETRRIFWVGFSFFGLLSFLFLPGSTLGGKLAIKFADLVYSQTPIVIDSLDHQTALDRAPGLKPDWTLSSRPGSSVKKLPNRFVSLEDLDKTVKSLSKKDTALHSSIRKSFFIILSYLLALAGGWILILRGSKSSHPKQSVISQENKRRSSNE